MNLDDIGLTLEQQFELRRMEDASYQMEHEHMRSLLLQSVRLIMTKDNVIRALVHDKARTTGI